MDDVIVLASWPFSSSFITLLSLLWYSGVFASIDVGTGKPPFGKLKLAYKFATGPYKDIGPLFTELQLLAPDLKICAIYYDDPKTVEHSKLRSMVAGVLAEGDSKVDKDVEKKLLDKGFKSFEIPSVDFAVHAKFPYAWDLSCYIAIMRVYPRLDNYITERQLSAHPAVEFYDPDTIHFVMPLSKQEAFYVPEASYTEEPTEEPETDGENGEQSQDDKGLSKSQSSADEKTRNESGEDSSSSFEKVEAPK
ncbi:hypothetical protein BSL78_23468 [Apostichopus japonicus]|uniref:Uncharacterized protein n=1 Tax=Stichopus japonicus TaxID=307972 RepID=A0A2G8JVB7_STIJA|nr:hypothetical protein BSL78_23468 [Apostichopus japonicus]